MDDAALRQAYCDLTETWGGLTPEQRDELVDGFTLDYAFHSGHMENDQITLHDTHEVFENRTASPITELWTFFTTAATRYRSGSSCAESLVTWKGLAG